MPTNHIHCRLVQIDETEKDESNMGASAQLTALVTRDMGLGIQVSGIINPKFKVINP